MTLCGKFLFCSICKRQHQVKPNPPTTPTHSCLSAHAEFQAPFKQENRIFSAHRRQRLITILIKMTVFNLKWPLSCLCCTGKGWEVRNFPNYCWYPTLLQGTPCKSNVNSWAQSLNSAEILEVPEFIWRNSSSGINHRQSQNSFNHFLLHLYCNYRSLPLQ